MAKIKDIEKVFDLEEAPEKNAVQIVEDRAKDEIEDKYEADFENARANIYDLLTTGMELLNGATEVAKSSEQSRSFEVAGEIFTRLIEANKHLVDLHNKKGSKTEPKDEKPAQINIEGNAIFSGSTSDLQKLLEKNRKAN